MLYGQGRRRLNRHISGVKADLTLGAALLSSSIILRDFFECCKWGTFRERPSPALDVCSQDFMRWKKSFIPLDPLPDSQEAKEFFSKPQRKTLVYGFLWLEKCTCSWPFPLSWLGKAELEGGVAKYCATCRRTVYCARERMNETLELVSQPEPQPRTKTTGSRHLCLSVLLVLFMLCQQIIQALPLSKCRYFGGINGYYFPHTSGWLLPAAVNPTSPRYEPICFQSSRNAVINDS